MFDGLRIKVFTRSFDLRLYRCSSTLCRDLGFPLVRLTDCSADGYFFRMLEDRDCDIAINIDEDAFLTDPAVLTDLIGTVLEGGYANAGCPDGGEAAAVPRGGDPRVTNPFFNIFDLRMIRSKFDKRDLVRRDDDLEPYYPFFHWLADNFKVLYLPSERHKDGFSTILKDTSGRPFCVHSWLARFYSMPSWVVRMSMPGFSNQKARIDALISESYRTRGLERPVFGFADKCAFLGNYIVRWVVKIPQRISRWPYKLARRIRRGR